MARKSPVHYIAPSAISLLPNCNGSYNDIAVNITRGTKIKVHSSSIEELKPYNGSYREWTLWGRNRRLGDFTPSDGLHPYTIYARLKKDDYNDGYLIFVQKFKPTGDEWGDAKPYVAPSGVVWPDNVFGNYDDYWYIRLGDVSIPQDGKRSIDLDTGILGTEQYNENWELDPDALPLRIELSCKVEDKEMGDTPYVYWGNILDIQARLVEGWQSDANAKVARWTVTRNTGDAAADAEWNGSEDKGGIVAYWQDIAAVAEGVERVYIRTKENTPPTVVPYLVGYDHLDDGQYMDSENREPEEEGYLPVVMVNGEIRGTRSRWDQTWPAGYDECTEHPQGPTKEWPYEWAITRKAVADSNLWEKYVGAMAPWATFFADPDGRKMAGGLINLSHSRTEDDFGGAVATMLTITAWDTKSVEGEGGSVMDGPDSEEEHIVFTPLASVTITVMAETLEKYELVPTTSVMAYDPQKNTFDPQEGIDIRIRTTNQRGIAEYISRQQFANAGITAQYMPIGGTEWTTVEPTSAQGSSEAVVNIPPLAFAEKKSLNVRLVRKVMPEVQEGEEQEEQKPVITELAVLTLAYVRNGEDSSVREWIYRRSTTSDYGTKPSEITSGEVNPEGEAKGSDTNKNQAGWVPNGWTDDPKGIDDTWIYEFESYRDSVRTAAQDGEGSVTWGDFSPPRIYDRFMFADTPIMAFRWYADGITPRKPTDTSSDTPVPAEGDVTGDETKAIPLAAWSATAPARPAGAWTLWMTQSKRHTAHDGTVTRDPWSPPTSISGAQGDTPIQAFRWYADGITPEKPTDTSDDAPSASDYASDPNKARPSGTWSTTAPNRPGDGWALWMTQSVRHSHGDTVTRDPWSPPTRISGAKGEPGEDSKEREWIYIAKSEETTFSGNSLPANIDTPAQESKVEDKRYDDFVPYGWSDNAIAVNATTNKYVYASWRDWNKTTKQWGPFQTPILWSNWGHQGIDGDGVQYIYKLFDHELTNQELRNQKPTNATQNANGEWMPTPVDETSVNHGWSDEPLSPDVNDPFCYCTTIRKINGKWNTRKDDNDDNTEYGVFDRLGLWSVYTEGGLLIDIDNEMDAFGTDADGYSLVEQLKRTNVKLFYGVTPQVITGLTATVIRGDDNTELKNKPNLLLATISWLDENNENSENGRVDITIKEQDLTSEDKEKLDCDLYVDITATCAIGTRTARFTLKHISSSAPGVSPVLYQLLPSMTEVVFARKADGTYEQTEQTVKCGYTKTIGTSHESKPDMVEVDGYSIYYRKTAAGDYSKLPLAGTKVATGDTFVEFILCKNTEQTVAPSNVTGIIDRETVPVVKDGANGQQGPEGQAAPSVVFEPSVVMFSGNVTGSVQGGTTKAFKVQMTVKGNPCTIKEIKNISTPTGTKVKNGDSVLSDDATINYQGNGEGAVSLALIVVAEQGNTWVDKGDIEGVVSMTITGEYNNKAYTAQANLPVAVTEKGADGVSLPGETGDMFYPMGEWKQGTTYRKTGKLIPLVFLPSDTPSPTTGEYGKYYYLSSADSSKRPDEANSGWTEASDFGFVITQGIFANFARLGSAVMTKDWLISANGTINGNAYDAKGVLNPAQFGERAAYTWFDPKFPREDSRFSILSEQTTVTEYRNVAYDDIQIGNSFTLLAGAKYRIIPEGAFNGIYQRLNEGLHLYLVEKSSTKVVNIGHFRHLEDGDDGDVYTPVPYSPSDEQDYTVEEDTANHASVVTVPQDGEYYIAAKVSEDYNSGTLTNITLMEVENLFHPNFAVDLLTGQSYQNNAYVRGSGEFTGTVKANLFFAKTKWFEMKTNDYQTYQINPKTEPYSNFAVAVGSGFYGVVSIYLPSAADYDGIEFTFFSCPFREISTGAMTIFPSGDDELYMYIPDSKYYRQVISVTPMRGAVKIKCYGDTWYVTEGEPMYVLPQVDTSS